MRNRMSILLAAVAAVSLLAGCGKDDLAGRIGFRVKKVVTKGAVITTENIATTYGSFVTDVWVAESGHTAAKEHGQNVHYINRGEVNYADGSWTLANEKMWLHDVDLCFWSWAPSTVNTRNISESPNEEFDPGKGYVYSLPFTYSLPTPNMTSDAVNQQDLLFAFNLERHTDGDHRDYVNIHFYHALSWIKFMVDKDDGFDVSLEIANIGLTDICTTASCLFKPGEAEKQGKFEWNNHSAKARVGQGYTIAGDFEHPKNNLGVTLTSRYVTSDSKAFMLIPQTTDSEAKVAITFKRDDDSTIERFADLDVQTWQPGTSYTYKIHATSLDEPITVELAYVDWIDGGTGNL